MLFKIINVALIVINVVVFFMPKKPMSGVHSNAAGMLALIALVMIVILLAHLILLIIALYFKKMTLLKIMTFVMVPASLLFWYLVFRWS